MLKPGDEKLERESSLDELEFWKTAMYKGKSRKPHVCLYDTMLFIISSVDMDITLFGFLVYAWNKYRLLEVYNSFYKLLNWIQLIIVEDFYICVHEIVREVKIFKQ